MKKLIPRRRFLRSATLAGTGAALGATQILRGAESNAKPAALGGKPSHSGGFPSWPVEDQTEETALLQTLRSRQWYRGSGKSVARFEESFQALTGAAHCVATSSGTSALSTALGAMDIGPGDEVIVPPYTFIATSNAVTLNFALPVFSDTDPESFQMDPRSVGSLVRPQTRVILPVHIGGSPADLDALTEIGRQRGIPVLEDACQAHLAEWRGKKVGTWGVGGCFSFQASKNLNSGEGGAVLTQNADFAERCRNFHNQGRSGPGGGPGDQPVRGSNFRLSEFQGSLLSAQMTRLMEQTEIRTRNAAHLTRLLREIPGIAPAKLHEGTTRSAFHLYMFRYDREAFSGLDRGRFLAALAREGIPGSGGYSPMNRDPYVTRLAKNRHFLKIYGERRMNEWTEQSRDLPGNDKVCTGAVWFTQNMLLGSGTDMEQIADAIRKIQKYSGELVRG